MGFLSQLIGAVQEAVEDAVEGTTEAAEQAADAAEEAAETAADLAEDSVEYLIGLGEEGTEEAKGWMLEVLEEAGVHAPKQLDVRGVVGVVGDVLDVTGRRVEVKLGAMIGSRNVETGKAVAGTVLQGPEAVWEGLKGVVRETLDADGRLRELLVRTGGAIVDKVPAEATGRIIGKTPAGKELWKAILGVLRGEEERARQAEHESGRLLVEVRWVAASIGSQQDSWNWRYIAPRRRIPRTPQGHELRRLSQLALTGPRALTPEEARRLAEAAKAAMRSALLYAEVAAWLRLMAVLARRIPARSRWGGLRPAGVQ